MRVFAPFHYDYLDTTKWDLAIVEGYAPSVPEFIHVVRKFNPKAIVLHYFLDTFEGQGALKLDVDGYLTNSEQMRDFLHERAPAALIDLAADPETMKPTAMNPKYAHNIVYLGQYKDTKYELLDLLRNLAPLGLAIYGNGWEWLSPEDLKPHFKGVLPLDDINDLYSSAKVVLGTTEVEQRMLGMVNNRVFEALAVGACFLGDDNPAQRRLFGDAMHYFHSGSSTETYETAKRLVETCVPVGARQNIETASRQRILQEHTYAHRVPSIHAHYEHVVSERHEKGIPRPLLPRLAILHAGSAHSIDKAEMAALRDAFRVSVVPLAQDGTFSAAGESLLRYDAVLIDGVCGDAVDTKRPPRARRCHVQ